MTSKSNLLSIPAHTDGWESPPQFPQLCRYLAERSPQPMVATEGPTHIVRYMNPAFRQLVGSDVKQLVGRPFVEGVPEGLVNQCAAMLDRVFSTGTGEALAEQPHALRGWDRPARGAPPTYWSYLAWAILAPAGLGEKPVGVMIQVTDASEIANFRRNSAAINEALLDSGLRQHELAAQAVALATELRKLDAFERQARQEAQAANASKDVFLATLSHELRTPLNAILGWAVMLRGSEKPLDKDVAEGLTVIERNARSQGKLIEDVLDIARITSGKFMLDSRPLDLTTLVFAAMDAVRPSADAKRIALSVSGEGGELGSLWVVGDASRLQQAVSNLLTNAIKFTAKGVGGGGGHVTVRVERVKGIGGDKARVIIADTGKGIDPEFLPHVFERFKQAGEGTTRSYGGLGLGLSIVRHIMEAHGGTARAQSDGEGRGATFTLELAASPESAPPLDADRPISTARLPRLDGVRVLVVDDDEDARSMAKRALESAGATVNQAASAEEGYRYVVESQPAFRPQVVVSDIGMPGEDGYSMMRRVRAERAGAKIPAVAMTAFAAPEDKRRSLLAGYQAHLPKPTDPHELIAVVAGLVGRTQV